MKKVKKFLAMSVALVMVSSAGAISANASRTLYGVTNIADSGNKNTSGGTTGYATVRTVIGKGTYSPAGGVNVPSKDVYAYRVTTNVNVNFTLSGTFYTKTNSYPYSVSGTNEAQKFNTDPNGDYLNCTSTTSASGTGLGSVTYNLNANF